MGHKRVTVFRAGAQRPKFQPAIIVAIRFSFGIGGMDQRKLSAATAGEMASLGIDLITKLGNGAAHPITNFVADIGSIIEHARNGRSPDPCMNSHVVNSRLFSQT